MYDLDDVVNFPDNMSIQLTKNRFWIGKLTVDVGLPVKSVLVGGGDWYQVQFKFDERGPTDRGLNYVNSTTYTLGGQLQQHPYCCGSVFLSNIYNIEQYILSGKSYQLKDVISAWVRFAELMGFSTIQYIVAGGQDHIREALEKLGWKPIHKVKNQRSNNNLTFYQFDLSPSRYNDDDEDEDY